MYRGNSRILPTIIVLAVIVVAVIALVAAGRALFRGGDQLQPVDDSASRALLGTDADHSVRMTVRGPIVAEENFRSYQVEIGPSSRRLTTYRGYMDQVIDNKQYINEMAGYVEFVHALDRANFLKEANLKDEMDDTRGICANGRLYTFEVLEAQSPVKSLWTTSCNKAPSTFKGNAAGIRDLFLRQIPDSREVLRKVDLSL